MPAKPTIFISYRRSDSGTIAGRIYDRLIRAFGKGNVFKDSHNIPQGSDFRGVIKANVARCNVVLVIIGQTWLSVAEKNNPSLRRLDNPNDWVRFEIETGLQIPGTTVIPVLVENASMPSADDLPPSLRELAYKNGILVRDDPDFDTDVARLIQGLGKTNFPKGLLTIGAIILLLAIVSILLLSNSPTQTSDVTLTSVPAAAISTTDTPAPSNTSLPSATVVHPTDTFVPSLTPTPTFDLDATNTEVSQRATIAAIETTQSIAVTSTLTASPTFSKTPTSLPSATSIVPTATGIVRTYPCPATVKGEVGRSSPWITLTKQAGAYSNPKSIDQGSLVEIREAPVPEFGKLWYYIRYDNESKFGWIEADRIVPSASCPPLE